MLSFARVVVACCALAAASGVRGWRVLDAAGSNMHFYDRDKLHQQAKRFDMSSDYFDPNAQQWGQYGGQGGGEGGDGGSGGNGGTGGGSHYFGDNVVFAHYDNSAKAPPRKEHISDGTLDSMQYCKCIVGPECEPTAKQPAKSHYACGAGQILCCYDGHPRYQQLRNSDRYLNDGPYNTLQNTGTVDKKWNPGNDPQDPGYYPPSSIPRLPNFKAIGGMNNPLNFENLPPGGMFLNERRGPMSSSGNFKAKKFLNNRPVLVRPGGLAGLTGPNTHTDIFNGPNNIPGDKGILVGPEGPTGIIGPIKDRNPPPRIIGPGLPQESPRKTLLTGPGGPKGIVGPPNKNYHLTPVSIDEMAGHTLNQDMFIGSHGIAHLADRATYTDEERNMAASAQRGVLVGPGGPTGVIGPKDQSKGRKGLLVGPGGPWGAVGPVDYDTSPSAQRGVLVGPGGPTGIIGPAGFSNRPNVLVGPGGPTGIIGPIRRPFGNRPLPSGYGAYGYRAQKTVLGPNWLSESPQRGVLVGPGGPTGQIGPPPRK